MSASELNDLARVRQILGKTQQEMAELLDISLRAVQSYEQGWRPMPVHVQKQASLLLFLKWKKNHPRSPQCYKVIGCPPADRAKCYTHECRAYEFCWLLPSNCGRARQGLSWEERLKICQSCPVMRRWLDGVSQA